MGTRDGFLAGDLLWKGHMPGPELCPQFQAPPDPLPSLLQRPHDYANCHAEEPHSSWPHPGNLLVQTPWVQGQTWQALSCGNECTSA